MFSEKIVEKLSKSSMIRAMFEEGTRLKSIYGDDNVFDFSIGNPEFDAPLEVREAFIKAANDTNENKHRYMSNAGYQITRDAISSLIATDTGFIVPSANICMTCGAAGGLNVVFKSLLNENDEVIIFSPYFVEYLFYIENHLGKPVIVKTDEDTFEPNLTLLDAAITSKTKAILLNSPNNPTGVIYSEEILEKMNLLIQKKQEEYSTEIYIVSDEPYSKIVYDDITLPSLFDIFKNTIAVNSFSKSHALPGERIGYIAVSPRIDNYATLMDCILFCNRTLGFVNAPATQQHVIALAPNAKVNVNEYKIRRDILYDHLTSIGFECIKPSGAFYLFPKSLIPNDIEFTKQAQTYNLLLVPGSGFGQPGYFRMAYCISMKTIENSLQAFTKLAEFYK